MAHLGRTLLGAAVLFLLALAVVWTAGRLSPDYTLDLGPQEWGRIQGGNDWEEHGAFTYRWTQGVTRFRLPVLGTPRRLTIRLDGERPGGVEPAAVTLLLDGRPAATFIPPAGPHLYHLVYSGPVAWNWETVVEVRTEPFSPPADRRVLGVMVDWLRFSAPLAPPAPSWALVLGCTALGLAVMALGETLGWPWEWNGLLAGLLVLAAGALLAWRRPVAFPWLGLSLFFFLAGAAVGRIWRDRRAQAGAAAAWVQEWDGRPGPFAWACLMLALAVAALPLLAVWLPPERSWALQVLRPFYPPAGPDLRPILPLLPVVVVAGVALPALNQDLRLLARWALETGSRIAGRVRPSGRRLFLGLLFIPLGYLLRAQVLWGDGPNLIGRVGAGYLYSEPEMLPFFIHGLLYRWTERLWGWSVPDVYTVTGLLAGALYITLAAALGDALGRSRFEKVLVFGLLATLATIQFGFGYLENYGFVTVALLALFGQMVRCLQGRGSAEAVAALWVVAVACHLQALLVGPAVAYTVVRAVRTAPSARARWRKVGMVAASGLIPAAVLMGLFLAGGYDLAHLFQGNWVRGNNPYMLVPLQSDRTYTLFSLTHLANVVNEHLLVAPVVLPLLVLVVVGYRRRVPWRDPVVVALALSASGLLLFASTLYPDLSAATDWDLFAPSALPYTLLTGYVFARAVPAGCGRRYAATVLLASAGVHAAMWVLLNARVL